MCSSDLAINWRDRSFATVLGDAGTATLCTAVPDAEDWFSPSQFWSWLDGSQAEVIRATAGGSRQPAPSPPEVDAGATRLAMDGAAVRKILVPFVGGPAIDAALAKANWKLEDLDLVTLHEANLTLNESIVKTWRERGLRGQVLTAGGRFGNTTSASIPLALALNPEALSIGKRFGLFGFGGGLRVGIRDAGGAAAADDPAERHDAGRDCAGEQERVFVCAGSGDGQAGVAD